MNPRTKKKLSKRIKSMEKELKKGYLKTVPIENLRDCMDKFKEKRKHFPHNVLFWGRSVKRKIGYSLYYLKCLLFHPYNKIKIKTLPPTWTDRDYVLLYACFTIFCSVIEEEELLEQICYDHSEEIEKMEGETWDNEEDRKSILESLKERHELDQKFEKEVKYLYEWWKVLRPERQKKLNDPSNWSNLGKDEKAYEEDTEHLIRLMKIRAGLWT